MEPSQQPDPNALTDIHGANPGYVLGQLSQALLTSETHKSPEVRARADRKVEIWMQVFQGMLSGSLQIGSRVPVAGAPAWATLEVVKGGFATGTLLAGGDLQPHEQELLTRIPVVPDGAERAALNAYYLSDKGFDELQQLLASGCYRVHLPEEGALLVVAWLVQNGHADQARALLDEIGSHFPGLRFYPVPAPRPLLANPVVHRQDVGATIGELQAIEPSSRFEKQKEAIEVWAPLYDRVIALFVETVAGPLPSLRLGKEGKPLRSETGKFHIEGGWPCQHHPDGWKARARTVLEDYRRLRADHQLCSAPESSKAGFPTLRRYLEQCLAAPEKLTGRDVGMIRGILAGLLTRHGAPGSPARLALRAQQAQQVAGPTTTDLARLLVDRLSAVPRDQGLPSLDEVLAPVSAEEAARFGLPAGRVLSEGLANRVRRCLDAPIEVLVEQGIIPSGEVLAKVVPQITSQVRAAGISDASLRRLYGAIYEAFRRRRSLLLLNLQSQVKLDELPWLRAINSYRTDNVESRQQARLTLEQLVVLAVTSFPQQILPNKLLQEIRTLADGAGLSLPIVDEVAADIFMGEFSEKFLRAAQKAGDLLEGTLYERYYGLSYARVRQIDDVKSSRFGTASSEEFARLCAELAGETDSAAGWSVARNGKIIEQEQILTTHNLAVLFDVLGLTGVLRPRLEELALRCFWWVCQRQQLKIDSWKARLQMVKNTAYAWRQMVFFLSLAPAGVIDSFLSMAHGRLREQTPQFQDRFRPALEELARAAQARFVEAFRTPEQLSDARRFLGWTTEKHWLLG